jgi:hypothetical protein
MNNRLNLIQGYISVLLVLKDSYSKDQLITAFQNNNNFDSGTKMEAIDFIKSNNLIKVFDSKTDRNVLFDNHKIIKIKKLEEQINSDIFLSDYTNVLKKTFEALENLDTFFKEFNIEDKFDLLENTLKLDDTILIDVNGSKKINLDLLKDRYKRSINAFSARRTLYID